MPLKKLSLRPGVNRENTRYTNENGWYESQWMRFRQGTPEKIGGFTPVGGGSITPVVNRQVPGVVRALGVASNNQYMYSAGTNGVFYQTPLGSVTTLIRGSNASGPTSGLSSVEAASYMAQINSDSVSNQIRVLIPNTDAMAYYILAKIAAFGAPFNPPVYVQFVNLTPGTTPWTWPDSVPGPSAYESPVYQVFNAVNSITPGYMEITVYALGTTTTGTISVLPGRGLAKGVFHPSDPLMMYGNGTGVNWSIAYFGTTTLFNCRGGPIWAVDNYVVTTYSLIATGGTPLGATALPLVADVVVVSDVSRFVMAMGTTQNETPSILPAYNPLLIRWADQESLTDWEPAATNQAGSLQLSRGSLIVAAQQARQEILVWTDLALYSLQYVGAPIVWTAQLVGENISIASQACVAYANGVAYWMGKGKFYKYSGTVQTLRCDLRKYIFEDLDEAYYNVVSAGNNEAFNEVWWHYVSEASTDKGIPDKYVVYNYVEDVWYYGSDNCSAMNDAHIFTSTYPVKAVPYYDPTAQPLGIPCDYYSANFFTEVGNDAVYNGQFGIAGSMAIPAYITSAEFDLDDGHQFMFVWRMLPDITFAGSTGVAPSVEFALLPMKNSGSGVTNPASVGGDNEAAVLSLGLEPTYTIEEFTGQVFTRIRARQVMLKVFSDGLGVAWQLGSPRLDMRPDGRR